MGADAISRAIVRGYHEAKNAGDCEDLDAMNSLIQSPVPFVLPKSER
jgi:hypothetical protein